MTPLNTRKHSQCSPHLSRGFFIALSVFLLTISSAYSLSNTQASAGYGQTLDTEGNAVPYVSLSFKHTNILLLSDESGYFTFDLALQNNDSILVQRIGYEKMVISTEQLFMDQVIRLRSTVLAMETVEVEAALTTNSAALPSLTKYAKTTGSGSMEHSKLLSRIPGISIRTYGGPAGISTLSMDGGSSSHTKVLVNGIDITSAQNGEADLSQLPLPFIESMSYIPFDISQSSSGGSDGIIKLESGDYRTHIAVSSGSYGHQAFDLNLSKQFGGFRTSLQFGQRREDGNYPVFWNQKESLRQNNDLDQRFAALRILGMLRPDLYWQFTAMESRQARGVAGLVWSPDTRSYRNDQLQLIGSTLGWIHSRGSTHFKLDARNSHENYVNPSLGLDSDHQILSLKGSLSDKRSITSNIMMLSELNVNRDFISSSDASEHRRISYHASATPIFRLFKKIKLIPAFKFHFSPELYQKSLVDLQVQIPLHLGPLASIAASQGESYKYPSFNDLYWEPGGNPSLQPEETQVSTAQLKFDLRQLGDLMLQWQQKESSNLIQWMPVHSYWQPSNIQASTRESSKLIWQVNHPAWYLSAFAHLSLITTIDHSTQKSLRYAPEQTSAVGLTWSPAPVELNINYNYVADRIAMYDYPEDTILDATELWSLSIAYTIRIKTGHLTLVISGDNLKDNYYETIRGYPEPGRSFKLTTTYTL